MTARAVHLDIQAAGQRHSVLYHAAKKPVPLTETLRREGFPLNTRCGQRGLCQACQVELLAGTLIHNVTGATLAPAHPGEPAVVQACQYHPAGVDDVVLRIPPRSALAYEPQVVSDFRINVPQAHDPLWQQARLTNVQWASGAELAALAAAQLHKIRPVHAADHLVGSAGRAASIWVTLEFQTDHWRLTGVTDQPLKRPLGVAIDIGTTTVATLLVDLNDGRVLARATDFNRQMHLGDDVLTRINLCGNHPEMLRQLQRAVVAETINPLLVSLWEQAAVPEGRVVVVTVAANTTMLHLFAGVDPSSLGVAPFTAPFLEHRLVWPQELGLVLPPAAADRPGADALPAGAGATAHSNGSVIHLLASAAAYVGADLTAGIVASGLVYDDGPSLLVDVGTNGEIILKHGARILGCATAAGPAFEGSRLLSGMRAGAGAISHLRFGLEPAFTLHREVIGAGPPVGLCGSAYIDMLGQGRQVGLLNAAGRFAPACCPGAQEHLSAVDGYGRALRVGWAPGKQPLLVSENDIATLLQAKAAIAAGITILLQRLGLKAAAIHRLYLAGGFGMHVNVENAIIAGLLPGFNPRQIQVVGNTSLGGAYLAMLEAAVAVEIAQTARRMEIIELNLDPHFESCYIDQLSL